MAIIAANRAATYPNPPVRAKGERRAGETAGPSPGREGGSAALASISPIDEYRGHGERNIRNIVLMRPINSLIEFKQIILSHYVTVGVEELDRDKLTPLLKLRYRDSIADAVADLGDPEQIGQVFTDFQQYLYMGDHRDATTDPITRIAEALGHQEITGDEAVQRNTGGARLP